MRSLSAQTGRVVSRGWSLLSQSVQFLLWGEDKEPTIPFDLAALRLEVVVCFAIFVIGGPPENRSSIRSRIRALTLRPTLKLQCHEIVLCGWPSTPSALARALSSADGGSDTGVKTGKASGVPADDNEIASGVIAASIKLDNRQRMNPARAHRNPSKPRQFQRGSLLPPALSF